MTTYPQAEEILKKVKQASKILLSLHIGADPDSIGSNLAFKSILEKIGKSVLVISPDKLSDRPDFISEIKTVAYKDIKEIDSLDFDLYIALDSTDPKMITHHNNFTFPKDKIINIDHHKTNSLFGSLNLIEEIGSCCELIYTLFKFWNFKIDKEVAGCLLFGIMGDTGTFRYPTQVTPETFKYTSELLETGVDYTEMCSYLYQNTPFETLKFWGLVLDRSFIKKIGEFKVFVSAVSFEDIQKVAKPEYVYGATSVFFQTVKDTDIGILLTEEQKGVLGGSLRSRTGVDVSLIAKTLGGGGHKVASGFTYKMEKNEQFEIAVQKVFKKIEETLKSEKNTQ